MSILFNDKSFCFTGDMVQLKRTHAEREVRSRKGLTQNVVNPTLDYLVIGSKGSPSWKHGNYGNKIEKARQLTRESSNRIKIVSEHDFMLALENCPAELCGEIESKLLVIRYKSLVRLDNYDHTAIEDYLQTLLTIGFHITASLEEPNIYQEIYGQFPGQNLNNLMYFNTRLVKELSINDNIGQQIMDDVAKGFEQIRGLDGEISYTEKKEGTASFITLLKSIPHTVNL